MNKSFVLIVTFLLSSKGIAAQTVIYNHDSLSRLTQVIYSDSSIIKYAYDAVGNRTKKAVIQSPIINTCPGSTVSFFAGSQDKTNTYQWQVDSINGFKDINQGGMYSGEKSSTLTLNNALTSIYHYKFRCLISNANGQTASQVFTLKIAAIWIGNLDSSWQNPANWSCGSLPDSNTDVTVNSIATHFPHVGSNVSCRSLTLQPGASITVNDGFRIKVTGRKEE